MKTFRDCNQEASHISGILKSYEEGFGEMVNLDKFQLLCSRNVSIHRHDGLVQLMGIKEVDNFDKYLGLLAVIGKLKSQIFNFVKDRD